MGPSPPVSATTTQAGAIGECLAAAGILEASGGRLSPFKPIADDGGLDLLLLDKESWRPIPLQIKARRKFDNEKAKTVQFDLRRKTYSESRGGYLLCIKLAGLAIEAFWLFPMADLSNLARPTPTHLVVVASAKASAKDRYTPYRMTSFAEVAARLLEF